MAGAPRRTESWLIQSLAEKSLRHAANNYAVQQELQWFQESWFKSRDNVDSFSVDAGTRSEGLTVKWVLPELLVSAKSGPSTQVRKQDQGLLKQVGLRTLTLAMAFVCERGFPKGNTHVMGCTNYRSTLISKCNAHVKKNHFVTFCCST